MVPWKLIYFMLLATVLALAMVWQSAALRQAGYRVADLRAQVAEQRAEQLIHRAHLSRLRSPQRIVGLVKWLGLELSERSVAQADVATGKGKRQPQTAAQTDQQRPEQGPPASASPAQPPDTAAVAAQRPATGSLVKR